MDKLRSQIKEVKSNKDRDMDNIDKRLKEQKEELLRETNK